MATIVLLALASSCLSLVESATQSHCLHPQSSPALQLMCEDDNILRLLMTQTTIAGQYVGQYASPSAYAADKVNQQFTYSRHQLEAIAELFPSDPVSWGSAVSNDKQAVLLQGIVNITHALLLQFSNIQMHPQPWQTERVASITKIHTRYQRVYANYLANPDAPLVNVIPKWYHGFYNNVGSALKNRSYTPDDGFHNRTFTESWFDHKPNYLYGPIWVSMDWRLEPPLHNLNRSFYALSNDGFYSSWYISTNSYLAMFLGGGPNASTPNAVNWVRSTGPPFHRPSSPFSPPPLLILPLSRIPPSLSPSPLCTCTCASQILNSTKDLANFTALTKQYLTAAQQQSVLERVIYAPEAILLATIVKLARRLACIVSTG